MQPKTVINKTKVHIADNLVSIVCGSEFATITRKPRQGRYQIIMSFPFTAAIADQLHQSGIIDVMGYDDGGSLFFLRKPFYETHILIDIIVDILDSYQQ